MAIELVVDSSAIIALIRDERGASTVESRVEAGAAMSAVNATEVCDALVRRGLPADEADIYLAGLEISVIAADLEAAVAAGALYKETRSAGLSLADRHCLALAKRLGVPVLTGDRQWQHVAEAIGVEVELFR